MTDFSPLLINLLSSKDLSNSIKSHIFTLAMKRAKKASDFSSSPVPRFFDGAISFTIKKQKRLVTSHR